MARAPRCAGPGGAAAAWAVEELAALGGELRAGDAGKPLSDGLVSSGERGYCRPSRRTGASAPTLVFSFQPLSCGFLGMDGGVCRERGLAGHALGQRAGVLCALSVLPVRVAWTWAFLFATAGLCAARIVGSVAGSARSAAGLGLGGLSCGSG